MRIRILFILQLIGFMGCTDYVSNDEYIGSDVVVESVIVSADNLVIKVSELIQYGSDEDTLLISDLAMHLVHNTDTFRLGDESMPGYYANNNLPEINENDRLKFYFFYHDDTVMAETIMPEKPQNVHLSAYSIEMERITSSDGFNPGMLTEDGIDVIWDTDNETYHVVKVELLEDTLDVINEIVLEEDEDIEFPTIIASEPSLRNFFGLSSRNIYYFGRYRVVVFKINQEYADLYESLSNSSTSLTNPLTNVENGWGIFTAMNSDTVYFNVSELK